MPYSSSRMLVLKIALEILPAEFIQAYNVGFPTIAVNSASHSNLYFNWPVAKEAIRNWPINVKKLSQTKKKTLTSGDARAESLMAH